MLHIVSPMMVNRVNLVSELASTTIRNYKSIPLSRPTGGRQGLPFPLYL